MSEYKCQTCGYEYNADKPGCPDCAKERSSLAPARGCAAPSEIQVAIRDLNAHIENLERMNRIGVSSSIVAAVAQREKLVAALCGAQHNDGAETRHKKI